jgi:protein-S-isoprenylcysteine O-methyltransferase Ste14
MYNTIFLGGIIYILGSTGLMVVSRKALRQRRSHGFYRFYAWEILLGMLVLNLPVWFTDPFSWHQLVSWLLLILSIVLVLEGLRLLREIGRLDAARRDASLLGLEKTSRLVTIGLYRYIRHPLYSSLLCLDWGIFFKSPSWWGAGLAVLCTFFLVATARSEERENIAYFGREYMEYMKHSRMFIPFIF